MGRLQSEGPLVVETDYEACAKDGNEVCFVCSLPRVEFERQGILPAVPIAASVLKGERYHDRPLYFSNVIVDRDSRFRSFLDLRGRSSAIRIRQVSRSGMRLLRIHGGQPVRRYVASAFLPGSVALVLRRLSRDLCASASRVALFRVAHRPRG